MLVGQEKGLGENLCGSPEAREACEGAGGTCITHLDGYYLESFVCSVIGKPGSLVDRQTMILMRCRVIV